MGKRPKGTWNKYNIKSPRPPNGKNGSEYYEHLLSVYPKAKADKIYQQFKYQVSHGQ